MNVIRSREQLKEMRKSGVISEAHFKAWLESPVFIYNRSDFLTETELEWCRQNICESEADIPTKMPFEFVTIITRIFDPKSDSEIPIVLRATSRPHNFSAYRSDTNEKFTRHSILAAHLSAKVDGKDFVMTIRHTGEINGGIVMSVYRDGKPLDAPASVVNASGSQVPRAILLRFCFDVFNPNSVVLRVEPKETNEPRSVEWRFARTHYLILNRKQAVACREQKRGPTEGEIIRAAHWRRAHLRRLSSIKYTHKRGLLVFVKQAWVGPTEWCGLDDKIYKVVNPQPPTKTKT